jgi:hypothetical protein
MGAADRRRGGLARYPRHERPPPPTPGREERKPTSTPDPDMHMVREKIISNVTVAYRGTLISLHSTILYLAYIYITIGIVKVYYSIETKPIKFP